MKVKHKDRQYHTNLMRIALNSVGINVDYVTTDLIEITLEKLREKNGEMNILDSSEIEADHERKWNKYFADLETEVKQD